MILSNIKIQEALSNNWLIIDPQPEPLFPTKDGSECPYATSAVDLRFGDEILLFEKKPLAVDLREGGYSALSSAISERFRVRDDQPFTLAQNKFVVARTLETITLPIPDPDSGAPCLAARIEGRSSYARCGLLVHFTAPTIHTGFSGPIALEMINFGPHEIQLHKGSYICQLIIEQVDGIPFLNDSQFHGQTGPSGA